MIAVIAGGTGAAKLVRGLAACVDPARLTVIGNTGDPATPYEGARKMADELGKGVGVHLTWKGEGHGAYGNGSDCVDGTINDYLLDGKVPDDNKVCES